MSNYFEIEETGDLPLEFEGTLIFEDSSRWVNARENNRFHELSLYQVEVPEGELYVVHIHYKTFWQGEDCFSHCYQVKSKAEIKEVLQRYDPIEYLQGYPKGEQWEEKQAALEQRLTFDWRQLKVNALKALGFRRVIGSTN